MPTITPNLWFDDDAEQAVDRYERVFDDASVGAVTRYDAASAVASGQPVGSVMTVEFELCGQPFVALNGGPTFDFTPAISFMVACPTADEVDELWAGLAEGGTERMALDAYPFSDRYGWTDDADGVSWQVMHAEVPARTVIPTLMFVGERAGQAADAIAYYTSIFDDSAVGEVARYGPDQPDDEGTVMHADFELAGQPFAAMDSAGPHDFDFTEAVSFVVDCADQGEIDAYWDVLTADGGEPGQCGWLTDRFGVSWQVVPTELPELLRRGAASDSTRVTDALLGMGKLDLEALERASVG